MASSLPLYLAFPILAGSPDAELESCPYPSDPCYGQDVWTDLAPHNQAKIPSDGVLVLRGNHVGGADADSLGTIELTVTKDGQPIAGALEATSAHGVLVWRPTDPWEPGAAYALTGAVTNPPDDDYSYGYCAPETIPLAADLVIDAAPAEALAAPSVTVVQQVTQSPVINLASLACCEGATPSGSYAGCGGYYVNFDPEVCAPTTANGTLQLEISATPAAAAPTAQQVVYTLLVDGAAQAQRLDEPVFSLFGLGAPVCVKVVAEDLASGAKVESDEQCHGQDVADQLGPQTLDPAAELGCEVFTCEVLNDGWDPMACTPLDPPAPTTGAPTEAGSESEGSGDASSGDTAGEDDAKSCACASEPRGDAALIALAGVVGLTRRRRR
jgi:MYXO-CTERM domain-containing protein